LRFVILPPVYAPCPHFLVVILEVDGLLSSLCTVALSCSPGSKLRARSGPCQAVFPFPFLRRSVSPCHRARWAGRTSFLTFSAPSLYSVFCLGQPQHANDRVRISSPAIPPAERPRLGPGLVSQSSGSMAPALLSIRWAAFLSPTATPFKLGVH